MKDAFIPALFISVISLGLIGGWLISTMDAPTPSTSWSKVGSPVPGMTCFMAGCCNNVVCVDDSRVVQQ